MCLEPLPRASHTITAMLPLGNQQSDTQLTSLHQTISSKSAWIFKFFMYMRALNSIFWECCSCSISVNGPIPISNVKLYFKKVLKWMMASQRTSASGYTPGKSIKFKNVLTSTIHYKQIFFRLKEKVFIKALLFFRRRTLPKTKIILFRAHGRQKRSNYGPWTKTRQGCT